MPDETETVKKPTSKKPISKKRLIGYFAMAYLGAAALLVAAVLPAEYGIDPLGIGKLTGINKLNETRAQDLKEFVAERDKVTEDVAFIEDNPFKTKTLRIEIEDLGEVEHKLIMKKGEAIVFSWRIEGDTPNGGVYFDFHGHPPSANTEFPEGFAQSYIKGENSALNSALTAPFDGYFGWFLMNLEEGPITVIVDIAGYWEKDLELYRAVNGEVTNSVEY